MPPSFHFFFASLLCGSSNVTYQRLWKIPIKRWNSRPLTVCFRSLLIGIEEKREMNPSFLLKHTQFLALLQPYSSGNYPNFFFFFCGEHFFLKITAGGTVLGLDEQQVWTDSWVSMLLPTLNLLTSAFYFPHSRTFLPPLFRMGLMLNSVAPGIT